MSQIMGPLRNGRFIIMALLTNFIVVPLAAYILIQVFSLGESLAIGLLLVSLAAGAPGLPKMAVFAKADTAAATSLMVLLVVVTILVMPITLPLLITGLSVTFWDIASGLILLVLIPLALSLFVRARYEDAAVSVLPFFTLASNLSLLILMVLMIVLNFSNVVNLLGSGGLLSSLILVILSLVGGYLLGGFSGSDKVVQSLGAGQHNIAAAMVVATMNFGAEVIVMVVVYSLISLVVMAPLSAERHQAGKALRKRIPRSSHADWSVAANRLSPVDTVISQNKNRLTWLVPIRHGQMQESANY
jgi:BASS family bile acid:Na+ symporter